MSDEFTLEDLAQIEARYTASSAFSRSYNKNAWQVEAGFSGENFLVASLGTDGEDGKDYYVVTRGVHASELTGGAKADAEFIANAPFDLRRLALAYVKLFNENLRLCERLGMFDGEEKP